MTHLVGFIAPKLTQNYRRLENYCHICNTRLTITLSVYNCSRCTATPLDFCHMNQIVKFNNLTSKENILVFESKRHDVLPETPWCFLKTPWWILNGPNSSQNVGTFEVKLSNYQLRGMVTDVADDFSISATVWYWHSTIYTTVADVADSLAEPISNRKLRLLRCCFCK